MYVKLRKKVLYSKRQTTRTHTDICIKRKCHFFLVHSHTHKRVVNSVLEMKIQK